VLVGKPFTDVIHERDGIVAAGARRDFYVGNTATGCLEVVLDVCTRWQQKAHAVDRGCDDRHGERHVRGVGCSKLTVVSSGFGVLDRRETGSPVVASQVKRRKDKCHEVTVRCELQRSTGWCGYCYATRRGRASHPGSRRGKCPSEAMTRADLIMAMKRPTDNPRERAGQPVVDEVLKGWLPELHAFLTETTWEDGKPRKTGTVMLLTEDGLWKAWIHDRDTKVSGWLSGESWEGLLESLNKAFGSGSITWRADRR